METMKAYVLNGIGDLRLQQVPKPIPETGEVLLQIAACGVCGSDIPRIYEKGTYRFPTIPGHEFSGRIEAVGKGVKDHLIGRMAAVFPLIPCRKCPSCEIGSYATCSAYDYKGSRSDGAFAEYVCVPAWNLIMAPEGLSGEELAMAEPAAVAVHALRRGGLDIGDRVLISGAGPIGLMLAQWARAWGASRVLLADVDDRKLAFAEANGFQDTVNPTKMDVQAWILERTGAGVDLAVEGAGHPSSWENCLRAARPGGRVVLMGNPSGPMGLSQIGYWEMLRKQLTVVGTWNSDYAEFPKNEWKLAVEAMAEGKIQVRSLITHPVCFDELGEAIAMMKDRQQFYNKVMWTKT
ncbi:galactitol-1-phosphate 5-dehydrogenase [Cohnella silvisoli]|uniref:Galactitol-1-phosphate 5-dehydrogenase n=1 Tax=Cohnella silvisoli TaxID=2873699 RepID=A0ABV1KXV6_9BACL|nr:galactitol-1-phosphate 5-dehydrogenase [Cohnella silvisoli]MCD9024200.1 galactitol-1-phosphate 5-dehydrogenase [Cohnella silvisoli]